MNTISRIRGIYCIVVFGLTTILAIGLIYALKKYTLRIRRFWAHSQAYFMNFSIQSFGTPDLSAELLVINHQSLIDIVTLEASFPRDICWIAKKEITDIPIFGHMIKAPEMISVDRNDGRSMIKMLKAAKNKLDEDRVIAIFPEGTRGDGLKLLKFQNGAKVLAEKFNLKIQPILVIGAKHIFDSKKLIAHEGTVSIVYLDAFYSTDKEKWYDLLFDTMQERFIQESSKYL